MGSGADALTFTVGQLHALLHDPQNSQPLTPAIVSAATAAIQELEAAASDEQTAEALARLQRLLKRSDRSVVARPDAIHCSAEHSCTVCAKTGV